MTKEVAKAKTTAVGTFDYGDQAGAGFEGVKGSDLSIPFINLLQSNSPEVENDNPFGSSIGDMLNSVTKELIKAEEGFVFLPVHREEAWVEWVPRTKGGGFVGLHDPNGEVVQDIIKANGGSRIPPKDAEGKRVQFKVNKSNELIETYYFYGLILNQEGTETNTFAVISFSSTKIKPYRDFLTSMFLIKGKPPMFANRARIKSSRHKNESGTYANYEISPMKETWAASLIDPKELGSLLEEAIAFKDMIANGIARADFNQQGDATATSDDETGPNAF